MATPRNSLAILASLLLIAACFVAGFLLMQANSPPPVAIVAPESPTPAPETAASAPDLSLEKLIIKKARYGDLPDGPAADVTQKVAALVNGEGLTVDATNDRFGDPAVGIVKKLTVDYLANGVARSRTVNEDEKLTIRYHPGPARLIIKRAIYGDLDAGTTINVIEKVKELAENDSLSVVASNDNFTDPAVGIDKKLRVDYILDGNEKSKTVAEGATLTISTAGN